MERDVNVGLFAYMYVSLYMFSTLSLGARERQISLDMPRNFLVVLRLCLSTTLYTCASLLHICRFLCTHVGLFFIRLFIRIRLSF